MFCDVFVVVLEVLFEELFSEVFADEVVAEVIESVVVISESSASCAPLICAQSVEVSCDKSFVLS